MVNRMNGHWHSLRGHYGIPTNPQEFPGFHDAEVLFATAWALVLSVYRAADDVVFGSQCANGAVARISVRADSSLTLRELFARTTSAYDNARACVSSAEAVEP